MADMIKAIITDVDGVIVGRKKGLNFPLPNASVIEKLKQLRKKGLPIILCTGKFQFGILEVIKQAELNNPHITDGGALIVDPLNNKTIKKHSLGKYLVQNILDLCIKNDIYIECYSSEDYFVQKSQICKITEQHELIIQKPPILAGDLKEKIANIDVIKLMAYCKNVADKKTVETVLSSIMADVNFVWTIHPSMLPTQLSLITVKGVSKKAASLEVLDYIKTSPEEILSIGDTLGDWNFMEICKYAGTVGDESEELKEKAKSKGEGNYFIGKSVDENGFLDILDYFKL